MADLLEMRNAMIRALLPDLLSTEDDELEQRLFLLPQEDIIVDKIPASEPI